MKFAGGIILLKWNKEMCQVAVLLHQTGEQEREMCVSPRARGFRGSQTDGGVWGQLPCHSQTQMRSFFNHPNTVDQSKVWTGRLIEGVPIQQLTRLEVSS